MPMEKQVSYAQAHRSSTRIFHIMSNFVRVFNAGCWRRDCEKMCFEMRDRRKGIPGKINDGKASAESGGVIMFYWGFRRRSASVRIACSI